MVERTRRAGVPLLLVNPVANLCDCPPFKTQHRDGYTGKLLYAEGISLVALESP